MIHDRKTADAATADRRVEEIQFRLIYVATFVALVTAGCIARILPWRISGRPRRDDDMSIIRRAKENAGIFSAIAFMG